MAKENQIDPATLKLLKDMEKVIGKQRKDLQRLQAEWKKVRTQIDLAAKAASRFRTQQVRINNAIKTSTQNLRKQNAELKKNARAMTQSVRGQRQMGLSLRGLALGGAGFYAFRRFREMVDTQIGLALQGGLGLGVSNQKQREFLSRSIQGNLPLTLGGNQDSIKALTKLQQEMSFLPADISGQLVSDFLKGFQGESKRQAAFIQALQSKGAQQAIEQFANQSNIQAANEILRAMQLQTGHRAGTLDAGDEEAVSMANTMSNLQEAIDRVIKVVADKAVPHFETLSEVVKNAADWFEKLPSGVQTAAVGAAALTATGAGSGIADRLLDIGLTAAALRGGKGKAGLLRRGLGKGIGLGKSVIGRGIGLGKGGLKRIPFGRIPLPSAGAALAVGAPAAAAAAAAGSLYTLGQSVQAAKDEKTALGALERRSQDQRLFDISRNTRARSQGPADLLKAKRQAMEAQLLNLSPDVGMKPGFFSPNLPESDPNQIKRLRDMIAKLKSEEKDLRSQQSDAPRTLKSVGDSWRDMLTQVSNKVKGFAGTLKDFGQRVTAANIETKNTRFLNLQDAITNASLAGSETALRALERDLASIGFLGNLGALPQIESENQAIRKEIVAQNEILSNIDVSTKQGQIESNQVKAEILKLRIQEKSNQKVFADLLKGALVSEALDAGRFNKILVTMEQNLGTGIAAGLVKPNIHTGNIPSAPSGRMPTKVSLNEIQKRLGLITSPRIRSHTTSKGVTGGAGSLRDAAKRLMQAADQIEDEAENKREPVDDRAPTFARNL